MNGYAIGVKFCSRMSVLVDRIFYLYHHKFGVDEKISLYAPHSVTLLGNRMGKGATLPDTSYSMFIIAHGNDSEKSRTQSVPWRIMNYVVI